MNKDQFYDRILGTLGVALNIMTDNIARVIELGVPPQDSEEFLSLLEKKMHLEEMMQELRSSHLSYDEALESIKEEKDSGHY
jgi:hypothetical protein